MGKAAIAQNLLIRVPVHVVDQDVAFVAVLGKAWRRRRAARNNDHLIMALRTESEYGQVAVPGIARE
jgi:hypothetical protein